MEPKKKRSRARTPEGQFKGNNPKYPDLNEAWNPDEVAPKIKSKLSFRVKPRSKTSGSAGKYSQKPKIRPSM